MVATKPAIFINTTLSLTTGVTFTTVAFAASGTSNSGAISDAITPTQHERNIKSVPAAASRRILRIEITNPANVAHVGTYANLAIGAGSALTVERAKAGIGTVKDLASAIGAGVGTVRVAGVGAVDVVRSDELPGTVDLGLGLVVFGRDCDGAEGKEEGAGKWMHDFWLMLILDEHLK